MSRMELRLTLIEDGHPDRTLAYRVDARDLAEMRRYAPNPITGALTRDKRTPNNDQHLFLEAITSNLGRQMADWRDDRDGLNGGRRQEKIAEMKYHDQ